MVILFLLIALTSSSISTYSHFRYEPICIDGKENYNCYCDPSSFWNSKLCVSRSLDSYVEIKQKENIEKCSSFVPMVLFPTNFTISLWVRPSKWTGRFFSVHDDTLNHDEGIGEIVLLQNDTYFSDIRVAKPKIFFRFASMNYTIAQDSAQLRAWIHLVWKQEILSHGYSGSTVKWNIYWDGKSFEKIFNYQQVPKTPSSYVILGLTQMHLSFVGDISHVNVWSLKIWNSILDLDDSLIEYPDVSRDELTVRKIRNDHLQIFYGNVIEWAHFREKLVGDAKLIWNTFIWQNHTDKVDLLKTSCNEICSKELGPKCPMTADDNIIWPRISSGSLAKVRCPSGIKEDTELKYAMRFCNKDKGSWDKPQIDQCLRDEIKRVPFFDISKQSADKYTCSEIWRMFLDRIDVLDVHTREVAKTTPVDFGRLVKLFSNAVQFQRKSEFDCFDMDKVRDYLKRTNVLADKLLSKVNEKLWNATVPAGQSAHELIVTLDYAYEQVMDYIKHQQFEFSFTFHGETFIFEMSNKLKTAQKYGIQIPEISVLRKEYTKESKKNNWSPEATEELIKKFSERAAKLRIRADQLTNTSRLITVFAIHMTLPHVLPYVPKKFRHFKTEQIPNLIKSVSSAIVHTRVSAVTKTLDNLEIDFNSFWPSKMLTIKCGSLQNPVKNYSNWNWSKCQLKKEYDKNDGFVTCICDPNGIHTILADINHDHVYKPPPKEYLLSYISFFGCLISFLCSTSTLILLLKFKTCSNTSAIHKNLAVAISLGKLFFMIGINMTEQKTVCQFFAVIVHYLILSCSCWVLNESFNLYILITYAAHAHSGQADSPMFRHYFMGWILPMMYVGAIFGANSDDYLSKKYCWINDYHRWSLILPPLSINMITILIMIFILKEHRERAYTKDVKANQAISIQSRAIWTQLILLSGSWSFAIMLIMKTSIIIHFLYGFFSFIQGVFFIVFFFFLNDEIRADFHKSSKYLLEYVNVESSEEGDDERKSSILQPNTSSRLSVVNSNENLDMKMDSIETTIIKNTNIETPTKTEQLAVDINNYLPEKRDHSDNEIGQRITFL